MGLPSPSRHALAAVCPASAALPQVQHVGDRASTRGNVLHDYLYAASLHGRETALDQVPADFREQAEVIDLDRLGTCDPKSFTAELALAYDVDAGAARVLGQGLGRRYDIGPREMAGTIDVVGLTDDAVLVMDYKTGHAQFGPAREVSQLRAYALFAARAFNRTRARVAIIRIREDGGAWFDWGDLDEFDLASVEVELAKLAADVAEAEEHLARGAMPRMAIGDHCNRCNAAATCPALMTMVRQFAVAPESLETSIAEATPEQLALAWERADALEKVVERVKGAIRTRARQAPIPVGAGKVLGPLPVEELVPEVALEVLTLVYGPEVAEAARVVTVSVTKASLEAALKAHVLKKGMRITHLKAEALDAIRAAKGVVISQQIRKHTPKSNQQAALSAEGAVAS